MSNVPSKHVFVSTCHDYADEFNVEGCFVSKRTDLVKDLLELQRAFDEGDITQYTEFYFGTNEQLIFDDFDDFIAGVEIKDCTPEFYKEFRKLTGNRSLGVNVIELMLDHMGDN